VLLHHRNCVCGASILAVSTIGAFLRINHVEIISFGNSIALTFLLASTASDTLIRINHTWHFVFTSFLSENFERVSRQLHEILARPNLEKVNVLLDGILLIVGHVILVKDSPLLALGLAGSTLDALIGVDVVRRPLGIILDEKDGIAWANIYTRTTTLALAGDHISHFAFASIVI
jgi:hypothetical protein